MLDDIDFNKALEDLADTQTKTEELRNAIVDHMVEWFGRHYEDPVESQPIEGGEYVWLVRQCDAREELQDHFEKVSEGLIDLAVEKIEYDGTTEWVSLKEIDEFTT
jgi:hypothetical protein